MSPINWSAVPWDSLVFGVDCYEISDPSVTELAFACERTGHYTVRTNPLNSKADLQRYGFYYCDTLIEPHINKEGFNPFQNSKVGIQKRPKLDAILEVARNSFVYDRFHRDFNFSTTQADMRYENWLVELYQAHMVFGLLYEDKFAGFIAVKNNALVLHAVAHPLRGKGLAKYLWTPVCQVLFDEGAQEITSSISATNLSVLNLYSSLGSGFQNPTDVYHRLTLKG